MRNPYKKFQNSSIHGSKVILCIKKRDERTGGRTKNPEAICPSNFFEVGGIKSVHFYCFFFIFNRVQFVCVNVFFCCGISGYITGTYYGLQRLGLGLLVTVRLSTM